MVTGCDIIEDWDDRATSGPGGRLEQLSDLIQEFMSDYGFEDGATVAEDPGYFAQEGAPAHYDPDTNTIFFDPDYLAGDDITPDEAVHLAMHEAIHAMDYLEDGSIDVVEGNIVRASYNLAELELSGCSSTEPESGATSDTGGW